ncbi:hypothetical protein D3C77_534700 [compost metagenome]
MRAIGETGEVELQRIALVDVEIRPASEAAVEDRDQVQVELHHFQVGAAVQQALGQRALAGADFHQPLAGTRADGAQDAVDHPHVMQEVLAEALAGAVLVVGHDRVPEADCAKRKGRSLTGEIG